MFAMTRIIDRCEESFIACNLTAVLGWATLRSCETHSLVSLRCWDDLFGLEFVLPVIPEI